MTAYWLDKRVPCPWCEYTLDGASDMEGKRSPKPGDLCICINCASLLMFDQGLIPQKISEDERRKILLAQPDLVETLAKLQWAVRSLDRRREKPDG
jgi:hypothetical protein